MNSALLPPPFSLSHFITRKSKWNLLLVQPCLCPAQFFQTVSKREGSQLGKQAAPLRRDVRWQLYQGKSRSLSSSTIKPTVIIIFVLHGDVVTARVCPTFPCFVIDLILTIWDQSKEAKKLLDWTVTFFWWIHSITRCLKIKKGKSSETPHCKFEVWC